MFLFWQLHQKLVNYLTLNQIEPIIEAYLWAADGHEEQTRSSGEPYITHPVAVACILADMQMDKETIMAALMHDLVEDTDCTAADIEEQFGRKVAELVKGVTKLTKISFRSREEAQAENFRKMMLAMVEDIRVIIIKLADRLHNMQTLGSLRPDKKRRIARETLEIYAPIAHRLGMHQFRTAFQSLGFEAVHPMRYRVLKEQVEVARGSRRKVFAKIQSKLTKQLAEQNVDICSITGREKGLYSIYKKMRFRGLSFSEVMDVYGFRVIAQDRNDCYRILGIVHGIFKPVPGRFKDYIAIPKANGYQSLHTTLFGPHGVPIEIQIRTEEMDYVADKGIAAHWAYKDNFAQNMQVRTKEWLQQLHDMQEQSGDSMEFIENVKIDLYPDAVYVFTPQGDIMPLPKGATVVDFAYAVHTDVGNHCIGAKVNRHIVPLSLPLTNGQTVEVKTDRGCSPNPAWLNFVVTGKAKGAIKHFLKSQREQEVQRLGEQLLEYSLNQLGRSRKDISKNAMSVVARDLGLSNKTDLLRQIGLGERTAPVVAQQLSMAMNYQDTDSAQAGDSQSLLIKGLEGMNLTFAPCCQPIPGDKVCGVLTKGSGIEVHTLECPKLDNQISGLDDSRLVSLSWSEQIADLFPVYITISAINRRGILAKVASQIQSSMADIRGLEIVEMADNYGIIEIKLQVQDRAHLAKVLRRLKRQTYVMRVHRGRYVQ